MHGNNFFFDITKVQDIKIVSTFYVLSLENKGENYSRKETMQGRILFKEIQCVDFWPKVYLILCPSLRNVTTLYEL